MNNYLQYTLAFGTLLLGSMISFLLFSTGYGWFVLFASLVLLLSVLCFIILVFTPPTTTENKRE